MATLSPTFFKTPLHFRKWFEKHHTTATELIVGFYKKETGKPSITWPESVDEALCFGWIDGVRRKVDEESYCIRFTPRRKGSHWSTVNVARIGVLRSEGRMTAAGEAAFALRKEENTAKAAFEQGEISFSPEQLKMLKANRAAWKFWQTQPAYYVKQATWYVVGAKKPETQVKRMAILIEDCAAGRRIRQAVPPSARKSL
jgi:uncharacterized protein YdeI (YjbR/CyaY-like superfamily)